MKKEDNSFGVASVVLGILALVMSSAPGIILAIIAIVFANKQNKISKNKWSKAGKTLGIIALILGIIILIVSATLLAGNLSALNQLPQYP